MERTPSVALDSPYSLVQFSLPAPSSGYQTTDLVVQAQTVQMCRIDRDRLGYR